MKFSSVELKMHYILYSVYLVNFEEKSTVF